jgi:amidohydrolase
MALLRRAVGAPLVLFACSSDSQSVAAPAPIPPGTVAAQVDAVLARDSARLVAFRRDLHRHPEVSGAEQRTAQVIADAMRSLGLEVRTGVGGHGVVATLRGARPGPLVAYRADMDAVPSTAPDPVDFPSLNAGVRHICGHDIHTTVALALATALHQVRDSLSGSVMFVFQPAEERATGAKAMLAAGLFDRELPVAIYGVHTAPYETGRLATTAGPMMAGRDRFDIAVSAPQNVQEAAQGVLQRVLGLGTTSAAQIGVSQPPDFVLVTAQPVQVEGTRARVQGTVIVASDVARARVRNAILTSLASAVPAGVTISPSYEAKAVAGVTNDSALTRSASQAVRDAIGATNLAAVTTIPPGFSEDFGSFQDRVPGVFFYLGVANAQRGWVGLPHSPDYVADERAIPVGARALSAVVLSHLRR